MDDKERTQVHEEKTEVVHIGTRQLAKVRLTHIQVGNVEVVPITCVRNLGVWLDTNLRMNNGVTKLCNAVFFYIYNIRRIRKYLTRESTTSLVHDFYHQ